jgi:outer membrane protein OmpA-like peptidoglycan-associated protein
VVIKRGSKDEGERPFWISFADMMTAMMVLFLLVMSVALLSVTSPSKQHEDRIQTLCNRIKVAAEKDRLGGAHVDCKTHVIDFGDKARFGRDRHDLTPDQEALLRRFVPQVIAIANTESGQELLKRVVVEGYTDRSGSYLHNLNLSLQRSQQVLCALLSDGPGVQPMTAKDRTETRRLFLVGGYSSNSAKADEAQSRRIELRLEFFGLGEVTRKGKKTPLIGEVGKCALPNS